MYAVATAFNSSQGSLMSRMTHSVGVATADVTPPVGIFLAGYAARTTPSVGVYQRLRATCVAIEDESQQPALLLTIDWLGFYERTAAANQRQHRVAT